MEVDLQAQLLAADLSKARIVPYRPWQRHRPNPARRAWHEPTSKHKPRPRQRHERGPCRRKQWQYRRHMTERWAWTYMVVDCMMVQTCWTIVDPTSSLLRPPSLPLPLPLALALRQVQEGQVGQVQVEALLLR